MRRGEAASLPATRRRRAARRAAVRLEPGLSLASPWTRPRSPSVAHSARAVELVLGRSRAPAAAAAGVAGAERPASRAAGATRRAPPPAPPSDARAGGAARVVGRRPRRARPCAGAADGRCPSGDPAARRRRQLGAAQSVGARGRARLGAARRRGGAALAAASSARLGVDAERATIAASAPRPPPSASSRGDAHDARELRGRLAAHRQAAVELDAASVALAARACRPDGARGAGSARHAPAARTCRGQPHWPSDRRSSSADAPPKRASRSRARRVEPRAARPRRASLARCEPARWRRPRAAAEPTSRARARALARAVVGGAVARRPVRARRVHDRRVDRDRRARPASKRSAEAGRRRDIRRYTRAEAARARVASTAAVRWWRRRRRRVRGSASAPGRTPTKSTCATPCRRSSTARRRARSTGASPRTAPVSAPGELARRRPTGACERARQPRRGRERRSRRGDDASYSGRASFARPRELVGTPKAQREPASRGRAPSAARRRRAAARARRVQRRTVDRVGAPPPSVR